MAITITSYKTAILLKVSFFCSMIVECLFRSVRRWRTELFLFGLVNCRYILGCSCHCSCKFCIVNFNFQPEIEPENIRIIPHGKTPPYVFCKNNVVRILFLKLEFPNCIRDNCHNSCRRLGCDAVFSTQQFVAWRSIGHSCGRNSTR